MNKDVLYYAFVIAWRYRGWLSAQAQEISMQVKKTSTADELEKNIIKGAEKLLKYVLKHFTGVVLCVRLCFIRDMCYHFVDMSQYGESISTPVPNL